MKLIEIPKSKIDENVISSEENKLSDFQINLWNVETLLNMLKSITSRFDQAVSDLDSQIKQTLDKLLAKVKIYLKLHRERILPTVSFIHLH